MIYQVNSGELNVRIGIYSRATTKGPTGESSQAETLLFDRWAKRIDGATSEAEDGQLVAVTSTSFVIRWDPQVMASNKTGLFLRDIDGDFEVKGITLVDARRRWLELKTVRRG